MDNKPLVFALGLFGTGLLAAAMVGVVYVTKLEELQKRPTQLGVDWSTLNRFEDRTVETGGVEFTVQRVYLGKEVNPIIRDPVRAECQDEIIFKLKARNLAAERVTLTPGAFSLRTASKERMRQNYTQGFSPATLASGETRTYQVGFMALTNVLPCVLTIEGDTLRPGAAPDLATFNGVVDVCPGAF